MKDNLGLIEIYLKHICVCLSMITISVILIASVYISNSKATIFGIDWILPNLGALILFIMPIWINIKLEEVVSTYKAKEDA